MKEKPCVLLVSPLPPPTGGIATWTVKYREYCEKKGLNINLVNTALNGDRAKRIAGRKLGNEITRTWRILSDMRKQLSKGKTDIVHLNSSCSSYGIYRDSLCLLLARFRRVPVVLQCHCNIQDQIHGRFAEFVFRFLVSMCEKVLVLNRFSEEYVKKHTNGKAEVIPNFIEEKDVYTRTEVSNEIRHAVFVGHVKREKGVCEIIHAAKHFPDIRFSLAGPVAREIEEMERSENVVLLGNQPREKVLQLLKEADVFIFPSHTEGFANALLEAMAAGLPVIATDVGANREMIDNDGGIIIPVEKYDAIVNAIHNLSAEVRRKMSDRNSKKVRQEYISDVVVDRLFGIYSQIERQINNK